MLHHETVICINNAANLLLMLGHYSLAVHAGISCLEDALTCVILLNCELVRLRFLSEPGACWDGTSLLEERSLVKFAVAVQKALSMSELLRILNKARL